MRLRIYGVAVTLCHNFTSKLTTHSKCEIKKEIHHLERDNIQIPFYIAPGFFTNSAGGMSVYPDKNVSMKQSLVTVVRVNNTSLVVDMRYYFYINRFRLYYFCFKTVMVQFTSR